MNDSDDFIIDCQTCIGVGTTACNDCIVTHLLANDDGPIDYLPVRLAATSDSAGPNNVAVDMFRRAGLVTDPVTFISQEAFEAARPPERSPVTA